MDERNKIEFVVGNKSTFGQEIRKKGNVNIHRFHKELVPWFHEFKYLFYEKQLSGKSTPAGREEKFEWVATRKIDSYFRFHIDTEVITLRERAGKAELTMRFKGYLEKDYKKTFRKYGKLGEFLRKLYERYVIKDRIDKLNGKLWAETNNYIDKSKEIIGLMTKQ